VAQIITPQVDDFLAQVDQLMAVIDENRLVFRLTSLELLQDFKNQVVPFGYHIIPSKSRQAESDSESLASTGA
jgi:hypothetical protein